MELTQIGVVRSTRTVVADDDWDRETSQLILDAEAFGEEALYGLDAFSHLEVVYHFHEVPEERVERGARRPRNNPDWPLVGIFAQRGKNRPNRIATTVSRIVAVEGTVVTVAGLDAIDGTPIVDIKPWLAEFGPRGAVHQPAWSTELMAGYWS
jgi:tRNA-Thr(GGU) m(6)t(6)A37 methyltransferase TsaA